MNDVNQQTRLSRLKALPMGSMGLFLTLVACFLFLSYIIPWIEPTDKMEAGAYSAYTESLIKDLDFNIADQLPRHISWYTSKTYNYPDTVSTGVAIVWLPFFLYSEGLKKFIPDSGLLGYEPNEVAQMLASLFFGLGLLILAGKLAQKYFKEESFSFLAPIHFLASGMFFFFIAIPTNNDITGAFVVTLLLIYIFWLAENKEREKDWAIAGLLSGFLLALKTTGGLYIILTAGLCVLSAPRGQLKKRLLYCLSGVLIMVLACEVNIYVQRGTLIEPKSLLFHKDFFTFNLPEILLGHRGYFIVAPIYLFLFFYLVVQFYNLIRFKSIKGHRLLFYLALFCGIKIFAGSFRFFSNEYFGPRLMLTDFTIMVLIIGEVLYQFKKKALFFTLFSLCSLWTLAEAYHKLMAEFYMHEKWFSNKEMLIGNAERIYYSLINSCARKNYEHIIYFLPLIFLLSYLLLKMAQIKDIFDRSVISKITQTICLISLCYLVSTSLNQYNNQRNVMKLLAEGYFKDTAVVSGPYAFGYENVLSEINLELSLAKERAQAEKVQKLSKMKETYLSLIRREIITDPHGMFKIKPEEAISYWDKAYYLQETSFSFKQQKILDQCKAR